MGDNAVAAGRASVGKVTQDPAPWPPSNDPANLCVEIRCNQVLPLSSSMLRKPVALMLLMQHGVGDEADRVMRSVPAKESVSPQQHRNIAVMDIVVI